MVGKFKYFKTDLAFFFPGKFIFGFKMTPQEGFLDFLKNEPISGKILVRQWAKMLLANQIAGFFKM